MPRQPLPAAAALTFAVLLVLVATPVGQAVADGPADLFDLAAEARTCRTKAVEPARPPADVDADLQRLHDAFDGLPGFVDVYHMPSARPVYQAVFVEDVPPEAADRETAEPVGLAVVPEEPVPADQTGAGEEGPGTVPSADDLICGGIRPGTWASGCTANFVYRNGSDLYIGSAGHCFSEGETVVFGTTDPGRGTVVFRMAGGVGSDFALIKVDDRWESNVSPEMCNFGGPVGGNQAGIQGEEVAAIGHGRMVGIPGARNLPPRARAGVGLSWGAQSFLWLGSMMGGDSGAPVTERDPAQALGTHTHSLPGPDALASGTRWDHGIAQAEQALGLDFELVTSSNVHLQP